MTKGTSRTVTQEGAFIYKRPNVNRYIRKIEDLEELIICKKEFTPEEYYCLYQTFLELYVYEVASYKQRNLLAPPVRVFYDNKNVPVVVFPYIQPICTIEQAHELEQDEVFEVLTDKLYKLGMPDDQIGEALERISNLCEEFNLSLDDILGNLSNCGYNPVLGFRVLDYGIDEAYLEEI